MHIIWHQLPNIKVFVEKIAYEEVDIRNFLSIKSLSVQFKYVDMKKA